VPRTPDADVSGREGLVGKINTTSNLPRKTATALVRPPLTPGDHRIAETGSAIEKAIVDHTAPIVTAVKAPAAMVTLAMPIVSH
jgi:hypothetical protein